MSNSAQEQPEKKGGFTFRGSKEPSGLSQQDWLIGFTPRPQQPEEQPEPAGPEESEQP